MVILSFFSDCVELVLLYVVGVSKYCTNYGTMHALVQSRNDVSETPYFMVLGTTQ